MVVVRIAPSPTGSLHIGTARTALFNFLYSLNKAGHMHLRIEDTDKVRSRDDFALEIIDSLGWLGIKWVSDVVYQSKREERYIEVAKRLIEIGKAYYCYASIDEIADFRARNQYKKFVSPWRDNVMGLSPPSDTKPVIRLKVEDIGESIGFNDIVQGQIKVSSSELDDIILVRSDGSPTYMFAVVVDDHDIGVTHVIRGDDHITNTFKQMSIYKNLSWNIPEYAHIPLIYGHDGTKLSKRHGAVSVAEYRAQGYLPEAICSYMMEMGWSTNNEILSLVEAAARFDLNKLNKSPARFDIKRLDYINGYYIREVYDEFRLAELIANFMEIEVGSAKYAVLLGGMKYIRLRGDTINQLAAIARFFIEDVEISDVNVKNLMANPVNMEMLRKMYSFIDKIGDWDMNNIRDCMRNFGNENGCKFAEVSRIFQAAVVGRLDGISVYEVAEVIGKVNVLSRVGKILRLT